MSRQRLLLSVLGGLFILSLIYAFWAMPRLEKAPPRAAVPNVDAKGKTLKKNGTAAAGQLKRNLLELEPQPFPGAKRDIFRFHGGWTPQVALPVAIAPPVAPPPPPPPPPPTPEQILREKVSRFTFLGFLDKGGARTVFLSGAGELYLVKQGDSFGKNKELIAQEVTVKELVVSSPGVAEVIRVPLVENERLSPAVLGSGGGAASGGGGSPRAISMPASSRPGGLAIPPRRILQQRPAIQAPPQNGPQEVQQESVEQPPDDGVKQEEPPNQEVPDGDNDGNKQ